jgi:hypothetical protein
MLELQTHRGHTGDAFIAEDVRGIFGSRIQWCARAILKLNEVSIAEYTPDNIEPSRIPSRQTVKMLKCDAASKKGGRAAITHVGQLAGCVELWRRVTALAGRLNRYRV